MGNMFSGVQVFQDDMSYESVCLKGGHILLEKISYGRSCIGGVHSFRMTFYNMLCFAWRHVLREGMFFLRVCIIGGQVLQFEMYYDLLGYVM